MAKLDCKINPIETSQYLALQGELSSTQERDHLGGNADAPVPKGKVERPTSAKRPHFSLLNKAKIKSTFNIEIPYWKDGLDDCLKRLDERK